MELPKYEIKCPLCGRNFLDCRQDFDTQVYTIECGQCGTYQASRHFVDDLPASNAPELLPYASAHTKQTWESLGKPARLLNSNWRALAEAHQRTSIRQRADKLLGVLGKRTEFFGAPVQLDDKDFPLVDAPNVEEMRALAHYLEECGWISRGNGGFYTVRASGHERLDPGSGGAGIAGQVFVAMAFRDELKEAWTNGFDAGLRECGLDPVRADMVEHTGKICDRIIVEIRRAQFVVADFTLQRPNVYYEAGFAEALGRKVIYGCRTDEFHRIEKEGFDIRQYPFIEWKDSSDLCTKLADRIRGLGLARKI